MKIISDEPSADLAELLHTKMWTFTSLDSRQFGNRAYGQELRALQRNCSNELR